MERPRVRAIWSGLWKPTQYRRTVWQCNSKFKGQRCKTPHLTEEEIQQGFIKAMNKLLGIRKEVIANLREVQTDLVDAEELKAEIGREGHGASEGCDDLYPLLRGGD